MTATELHQTDPEFQALIQCWIADKRCPIPMADYLRERGLEGQAEAAEWAAWEPDRPEYGEDTVSGLFPLHRYWFHSYSDIASNCLPEGLISDEERYTPKMTYSDCLLWFLDRWAEVAAQGVELPKAKVGVGCG